LIRILIVVSTIRTLKIDFTKKHYWIDKSAHVHLHLVFAVLQEDSSSEIGRRRLGTVCGLGRLKISQIFKIDFVAKHHRMKSLPMELPEDVLFLVRQFAKPLLRYPKEYRNAMRALGIHEWPLVKERLSTPCAERVLETLQHYVVAFSERKKAHQLYEDYWNVPSSPQSSSDRMKRWVQVNLHRDEYRSALTRQSASYVELVNTLFAQNFRHAPLAYVSDSDEE